MHKLRIKTVLSIVKGNETAERLVAVVLTKAHLYVSAVCALETYLLTAAGAVDPVEREHLGRLRSIAHNSLIDSIAICNRYILERFEAVPVGGVYDGSILDLRDKNRRAIGDWAGDLVSELFDFRS